MLILLILDPVKGLVGSCTSVMSSHSVEDWGDTLGGNSNHLTSVSNL